MDITLFYFGSFIILALAIIASFLGRERGILTAFIGGVLGIVFVVQVNTDGAFQGLASGAPTGVWPALYVPIFFILFNFTLALYEGFR